MSSLLVPDRAYPLPAGEARWGWATATLGAAVGAALLGGSRPRAVLGAIVGAWLAGRYLRAA
jgi:hypothetical protein